jgi:hypothetical protein
LGKKRNLNDKKYGNKKKTFFLKTSKISKPKDAFQRNKVQETVKLVLNEIVNHPTQILPCATHLPSHCYKLKSFVLIFFHDDITNDGSIFG